MSRVGAGLAAAGFLVSAGSAFFLVVSFLMIGLTPLPLVTGGMGVAMVVVGLLVAGWFASPDDREAAAACRVCRRPALPGAARCASCGRSSPAADGRLGCAACGTDNEPDSIYCKACASAL
jgi:hypothetical protein